MNCILSHCQNIAGGAARLELQYPSSHSREASSRLLTSSLAELLSCHFGGIVSCVDSKRSLDCVYVCYSNLIDDHQPGSTSLMRVEPIEMSGNYRYRNGERQNS